MRLIAHRALKNGPNRELENHPSEISSCLEQGFEVEVDVWYQNLQWWLGHDEPTYLTSIEFLNHPGLWLHAKNFEAADRLVELTHQGWEFNFFSHDRDPRALTSHGLWWTQPGLEFGPRSIVVMPEWHVDVEHIESVLSWNCAGVCSDYVDRIRTAQRKLGK